MTARPTARLTVACIQNAADMDVRGNIARCEALVREAAAAGARLVSLPEYCTGLDVIEGRLVFPAFAESEHPALPAFRALAQELGLWINLGSLPIREPGGKCWNRGYLLSPEGAIAARYDKLHLYDVTLPDGEVYRESETIRGGEEAVVAATPWGPLGLSICYDLRFAPLYRALAQAGARLLLVPAAFARTTGEHHWHVLLRARAIETGSFVAAACMTGEHPSGGGCYGHSLIVGPWGQVLADGGTEVGMVLAEIDLAEAEEARRRIPAWNSERPFRLVRAGAAAEGRAAE